MTDQSRPSGESRSSERGSLLRQFIDRFQHLLGAKGDASLRESLEDVLEEHENAEESLTSQERLMLLNILDFNELRVEDVMVPRADIIAIDETQGLQDVLALFSKAAHSRLPVYRETLDDPVGMYHIKDVIRLLVPSETAAANETETQKLARLRRPVLFVPPSMPAIDLLIKMQTTHNHLALVIDEYGGTDGLVSIEDLVEKIVGDLEDGRENGDKPMLVPLAQGGFEADARLGIEEFEKAVGRDVVPKEREEDLDTLGGLVASLVGRVPQRGEIISHPQGLEFEVLDADPRRLKRLRVRLSDRTGEAKAADEQDSEPRP
jgi:CBS domain containing-hemolysin-like protein